MWHDALKPELQMCDMTLSMCIESCHLTNEGDSLTNGISLTNGMCDMTLSMCIESCHLTNERDLSHEWKASLSWKRLWTKFRLESLSRTECATWLYPCVWHDSLVRDVTLWMEHSWNQSCACATWFNSNVWHDLLFRHVTSRMRDCSNHSLKCAIWLNPCVWHDSLFRDVTSRMNCSCNQCCKCATWLNPNVWRLDSLFRDVTFWMSGGWNQCLCSFVTWRYEWAVATRSMIDASRHGSLECEFVTHCEYVSSWLIVNVYRMSSCDHIYDRCLRRD